MNGDENPAVGQKVHGSCGVAVAPIETMVPRHPRQKDNDSWSVAVGPIEPWCGCGSYRDHGCGVGVGI